MIHYAICSGCGARMSAKSERAIQDTVAEHMTVKHPNKALKSVDLGFVGTLSAGEIAVEAAEVVRRARESEPE